MATWQWNDYGGSTDIVLFSASPANSGFQWLPPYQANEQPNQVYVETLDSGVRVYDLDSAPKLYFLEFAGLPEGNLGTANELRGYLGIQHFLSSHTTWGVTAFGFWDHAGAAEIKVRYVRGFEGLRRNAGGFYQGTIVLREELV